MKSWANLFRVIIILVGIIVIAVNAELYVLCKQQQNAMKTMDDEQKVESQVNSNKFKYQQDQIEHMTKDLEAAQQQIKDQNDALSNQKETLANQKDTLLQEVEKRQKMENEGKNVQTTLVDIKAEADAIKEDMKRWQKDYVSILAELEKKMDDSQSETKNLEANLAALNIPELKENINSLKVTIEKITHPADNGLTKESKE